MNLLHFLHNRRIQASIALGSPVSISIIITLIKRLVVLIKKALPLVQSNHF